jgi:thiol-disulfide isomerase/thioredoxin
MYIDRIKEIKKSNDNQHSAKRRARMAGILAVGMMSLCLMTFPMPSHSFSFAPSNNPSLGLRYQMINVNNVNVNIALQGRVNSRSSQSSSPLFISNPNNDANNETPSASPTSPKLTAQERILQESLGINPETPSEKLLRIQTRDNLTQSATNQKRTNGLLAILAFTAAILNYAYQFTHPITSLTLLTQMQNNSAELNVIGTNGKPTVVDFWAPWCENCKAASTTLASIEEEYGDRVNFIMVNGDKGENWPIIERFGVDAIPHLAMVDANGVVETALIGPIPRTVLREDLNVMIENASKQSKIGSESGSGAGSGAKESLPYTMYDAFRSKPDLRQLSFSSDASASSIRLGKAD